MSQRFSILKEELWTDRKFLALSTDARLLFIWAWSPPHSAACGLYRASWKQLKRGLGAQEAGERRTIDTRLEDALQELDARGMVRYDREEEVLWVVNRVKHAATSRRAATLMAAEVRSAPDSPLVDEFLVRYGKQLGLSRAPATRGEQAA